MNRRRIGDLIARACAMPPQEAIRKALGLARRTIHEQAVRQRDRYRPTLFAQRGFAQGASVIQPLAQRIANLDAIPLEDDAELLRPFVEHDLAHRFNLLGSGWVEVRHGAACPGLEGHCYSASEAVNVDQAGHWLEGRINRANLAAAQSVWCLVDHEYQPIDWQLDFRSGYRWSEQTWFRDIEYGHRPGVDIKMPWELSRMQHLPRLAWASALARRGCHGFQSTERYEREFRNQVLDFIATNPPRYGVNWACTMDVALRAVNWLVAYDLFRAAGARFDEPFDSAFAKSIFDHGWHIARHLEWSPDVRGNHYLSDLVGLLFVAAYLTSQAETNAWLVVALAHLEQELALQFREDGTNFEASTGYHRLAGELAVFATALVCGLPEEKRGVWRAGLRRVPSWSPPIPVSVGWFMPQNRDLSIVSPAWLEQLTRVASFSHAITKPNGQVIQIGDLDSGRVLKLHPLRATSTELVEDDLDHRPLVAACEALTAGSDECGDEQTAATSRWWDAHVVCLLAGKSLQSNLGATSGLSSSAERSKTTTLLGKPAVAPGQQHIVSLHQRHDQPSSPLAERRYRIDINLELDVASLRQHSFEQFGLYIYRSQWLFLAVRCGGRGQIAHGGHEHVDQLSLEIQLDGVDLVRDPGSFVYTSLPAKRNQYRSAAAHFVPHFGTLDQVLYPERLDRGLFELRGIQRAQCITFTEHAFVGQRRVGEWLIERAIHLEADAISIHDRVWGPQPAGISTSDDDGQGDAWRSIVFSPGYGRLASTPTMSEMSERIREVRPTHTSQTRQGSQVVTCES